MARAATTWKPGISGNPNGKPNVLRRARGLLRTGGPDAALGFLAQQLEGGRTPYRVAKSAAEILRIAAGEPVRRHRYGARSGRAGGRAAGEVGAGRGR